MCRLGMFLLDLVCRVVGLMCCLGMFLLDLMCRLVGLMVRQVFVSMFRRRSSVLVGVVVFV